MKIESALINLGFKENNNLKSQYFVLYSKGETHLFLYLNSLNFEKYFSSASGEFYGNTRDLITFFYNTENSSMYNEEERISMFYELHKCDTKPKENLKPIKHFNLYEILLKEANKPSDTDLINCLETSDSFHFLFLDEERNKNGLNVLGVVSLNKKTKKETVLTFSELNRSIYFTSPQKTDKSFIFNSFSEMLAFKELQAKSMFYIVVKGSFNSNHAKTISMVLSSRGIKTNYLAFPDNLKGYHSDLNYLSVFSNFNIKPTTGYYKLNIPFNPQSEMFLDKLRTFKKNVEKDLNNNQIKTLIGLKEGISIKKERVIIVEVAKISNIMKGVLVLCSKFLFKNDEFKIIKPKTVLWSNSSAPITNAEKEYKLNTYSSIKDVYTFN